MKLFQIDKSLNCDEIEIKYEYSERARLDFEAGYK